MESENITIRDYAGLLKLLEKDAVPFQAQVEERSVRIGTKKGQLEGVMLIRWQDQDGVAQFIQSIPFETPEEKVPAVESAIVRINHAMALPGFGFHHKVRVPYFRLTAPLHPGVGLSDKEIRAYFSTCLRLASQFFPALKRVALEDADPSTVVADARFDQAMS